MQAVSYYRERSGSKCGVCLQMPATTRAHALGAGRTGSQEGDPRGGTRWRPISQSLRLQGETTSSSGLALNPGGEGHNEARRAADGGNGAGGTMPSPVQRASFGGGSVPPPEPPQGATATIAKTPFFSVANAFERTDRAMDFFL